MGWVRKFSYLTGGALLGQHFRSKEEQTAHNTHTATKRLKEQNKLLRQQQRAK